jgi:endonuclease-3 related protein
VSVEQKLARLYADLRDCYGHQHWWPADDAFGVMVGAVLTQNTRWQNVEAALARLGEAGMMDAQRMAASDLSELHPLVRPAGYYRQKSARLSLLARWFVRVAAGRPEALAAEPTCLLRGELLGLRGIGPETADSILLYALRRPVFVVDAYTKRVAARHGLIGPDCSYEELQVLFTDHVPEDLDLYQDFHAQMVKLGTTHCRRRPVCDGCPARGALGTPVPEEDML